MRLALSLVLLAAPAQADLLGDWRTQEGAAVIRLAPCGGAVCGTIVAFAGPPDAADTVNPDPARRGAPICGLTILGGLTPRADGALEGGTLYDPQTGESHAATLRPAGDAMEVRAFVGTEAFDQTLRWTRAPDMRPCR